LGLISYEAGRMIEPAVGVATDEGDAPVAWFWRYDQPSAPLPPEHSPLPSARAWASPSEEEHRARIEACRRRIGTGEIYQANLSRRIHLDFDDGAPDGLQLTRSLQAREQHSYSAWLEVEPGMEIVSLTPEALLHGRVGHDKVSSFPIKGTAGPGEEHLTTDLKERAEHTMIVDLVRNDLGRVAVHGSVFVEPLLGVRDFRTLRHVESGVRATLKPGADVLDALEALLPGGSITGAPKIQATRVIAELEQRPRGFYTGSLLAIDGAGNAVASLLIRTMVLRGEEGWLDVGGGIVWGSEAEKEVQETRRKALAHLEGMVAAIP
jgi:anthranilate/para-aminobenzoate synthase component I